jgi:hypothetical protein
MRRHFVALCTLLWSALLLTAIYEAWTTGAVPFADPGEPGALTALAQVRQVAPPAEPQPTPAAWLQVALLQQAQNEFATAVLATSELPLRAGQPFATTLRFMAPPGVRWSGGVALDPDRMLSRPLAAGAARAVRSQRLPANFVLGSRGSYGAVVRGECRGERDGSWELELDVQSIPGADADERLRADRTLPRQLELPLGAMAASGIGEGGTVVLLQLTANSVPAEVTAVASYWHAAAQQVGREPPVGYRPEAVAAVAAMLFGDRDLAEIARRDPAASPMARVLAGSWPEDAGEALDGLGFDQIWRAVWLQRDGAVAGQLAGRAASVLRDRGRLLPPPSLVPPPSGEVGDRWDEIRNYIDIREHRVWLWLPLRIALVLGLVLACCRRAPAPPVQLSRGTMLALAIFGLLEVLGITGLLFWWIWSTVVWRRMSGAMPWWVRMTIAVGFSAALLWSLRWLAFHDDIAVVGAFVALGRSGCWLVIGWLLASDSRWRAPAAYATFLAALLVVHAAPLAHRIGAGNELVHALGRGAFLVAILAIATFVLLGRRGDRGSTPAPALPMDLAAAAG